MRDAGRNLTSHLTPGHDADIQQLVRRLDDLAVVGTDRGSPDA
jgi:hypothetical protein